MNAVQEDKGLYYLYEIHSINARQAQKVITRIV